jgi:F-type H+-transporting ATPase subunit a
MNDPKHDQLIAQAGHPATEHTTAPKTGTAEAGHSAADESPFNKLLGELGDHREISIGPLHVVDLPVILIDNGLHVYPSVEKMQEAGQYEFKHHHIYRTGTETAPTLDLSITSLIAFQWIAMLLLFVMFVPLANKYKKNGVRPVRGFLNALEALILYVQDEIVLPNTGEDGRKYMPTFLTFFFFILTMNFVGLVPGGHTATGSLNVTAGLAIIAFFVIQGAAISKIGLGAWLKHLTGGVPAWLLPIMVPVEVLGLFTKPFALCVRLFANMIAGHVILLSLIGLVFISYAFIPVTIGFSLFINILELLVAVIQAYIFTILVAVFVGIGTASHDDHDHASHGVGATEHAAAH